MPNNTLLMIGIGLAAFTLFRREETAVGEEDLVNASMLASGTGETGKALGRIPTIAADTQIGGQPPAAQPMEDPFGWLRGLFAGLTPPGTNVTFTGVPGITGTNVPVNNRDPQMPNTPKGPEPRLDVSPFVQTPTYIRTTGERAGEALRQLGIITQPGDVDLLNPKIYVQEITTDEHSFGPLTTTEDVQIVAGGANPGDPYYTKLDVLAAYRDLGGFGPVTYAHEVDAVTSTNETLVLDRDQDATLAKAMRQRDRLYADMSPRAAAADVYDTGLEGY